LAGLFVADAGVESPRPATGQQAKRDQTADRRLMASLEISGASTAPQSKRTA